MGGGLHELLTKTQILFFLQQKWKQLYLDKMFLLCFCFLVVAAILSSMKKPHAAAGNGTKAPRWFYTLVLGWCLHKDKGQKEEGGQWE